MTVERRRNLRRRAPRAPFVVTFALGAAAVASACGGKGSGNGDNGDGSVACPAEEPAAGSPCDLPSSTQCAYQTCLGSPSAGVVCQGGNWVAFFGSCNPPAQLPEAGPDASDAGSGPDVFEAGPDVHDGGTDGEGQDGGHD